MAPPNGNRKVVYNFAELNYCLTWNTVNQNENIYLEAAKLCAPEDKVILVQYNRLLYKIKTLFVLLQVQIYVMLYAVR